MVCKECGSYNAENLSVCKECGAKLRDDDTTARGEETRNATEDGRPSREFVKAPSWPKSAYSGAPEKPISETPVSSGSFRPTIPPRAAASAPAATCPHCGKPVVSDAPFCAYCGQRIAGEPASAAVSARPTAKPAPAPAPVRATYSATDFDDEDDDDYEDEDEEEYKPTKPAKRGGKMARRNDAEELDEYDDEEEFDEEEYDELPPKRAKGTTILFWGLIVLLLALIAIFGMYIAKKNFDGDVGKMFASIGSVFNKSGTEDVDAADATATADPESQMYTASISEYTDPTTSEVYFDIDIYAPTGSAIRIITDATLKENTTTVPSNNHVILRISREVFMPNAPVDSETVTITPNIQVIATDGTTTQLTVPEITVTVPTLSMTVTEPAADTVNATFDNSPIAIMGQVNNYDGETAVFVNDEQVFVDSTGLFTASYTPKTAPTVATATEAPVASTDPAATPDPEATTDPEATEVSATPEASLEDAEATEVPATTEEAAVTDDVSATGATETITIEARKNNCVTARKVITVEPYVVQTMSFTVTNDLAGLSSDAGTVTVTGTATPGAVITATCPSADVTFGQAIVSETGTFSMVVTIAKVGAYDVSLVGKLTGYYDGTANIIVERPPTDSSSTFKKASSDLTKSYEKIVAGTVTSGDFVFTGKVTEIISTDPYTIFKVKLSDDTEVIVANRSAKSTINSSDVKDKKQIAGTLKGLYTDGKTPYIWGWFIWNK